MATYPAKRDPNRCPTHPGEILAEALEAIGEPKLRIAGHLGISRQHLNDILGARKPITANVAVRIGKLIGNGPDIWLRVQAAHDAWHAARAVDINSIPTLKAKAA
ncbi:MAG: HigA family addiction module antidote protein [Xanthobacteraceae bacterium]|nr:HigA family addiction module antidote protein [Xanthobacteraceae bacterium]